MEAELLLAQSMHLSRAGLLARLAEPLSPEEAAQFAGMVARRAQHEPFAYIVGHQEFYGLDFIVDRRVLVPRPETELLVDRALIQMKKVSHVEPVVADIGTGSGAIALALAHKVKRAKIIATDISPDALTVAKLNAERLGLSEQVVFQTADLLEGVQTPIDVLVANLPYIPLERFAGLPREVRDYEPRIATLAGLDGLGIVRRLLNQVEAHLTRRGVVVLEISEEQGKTGLELARHILPRAHIHLHQDMEGLDRVIEIALVR